ncbi:MAG TPA: hypothetical protein VFT49_03245 [Candidatus Saccharimonadales bacterium]|nr:hypothetical protein [Candidatus Saccharimonadales bacterium]
MNGSETVIDIPVGILPAKSFEEQRKRIYALRAGEAERALSLTRLVEMLPVGSGTAYEAILDEATDPVGAHVCAADDVYRVVLGQDGLVAEIQHVVKLAEDQEMTRRAHAMAAHVPWGPKTNGSSFRTGNVGAARPRMH